MVGRAAAPSPVDCRPRRRAPPCAPLDLGPRSPLDGSLPLAAAEAAPGSAVAVGDKLTSQLQPHAVSAQMRDRVGIWIWRRDRTVTLSARRGLGRSRPASSHPCPRAPAQACSQRAGAGRSTACAVAHAHPPRSDPLPPARQRALSGVARKLRWMQEHKRRRKPKRVIKKKVGGTVVQNRAGVGDPEARAAAGARACLHRPRCSRPASPCLCRRAPRPRRSARRDGSGTPRRSVSRTSQLARTSTPSRLPGARACCFCIQLPPATCWPASAPTVPPVALLPPAGCMVIVVKKKKKVRARETSRCGARSQCRTKHHSTAGLAQPRPPPLAPPTASASVDGSGIPLRSAGAWGVWAALLACPQLGRPAAYAGSPDHSPHARPAVPTPTLPQVLPPGACTQQAPRCHAHRTGRAATTSRGRLLHCTRAACSAACGSTGLLAALERISPAPTPLPQLITQRRPTR